MLMFFLTLFTMLFCTRIRQLVDDLQEQKNKNSEVCKHISEVCFKHVFPFATFILRFQTLGKDKQTYPSTDGNIPSQFLKALDLIITGFILMLHSWKDN